MHVVSKGKKMIQGAAVSAALLLAVGCASQQKASGLDRVSANQKALIENGERLSKAQSELSAFQGTLKDLQATMAGGKDAYSTDQAKRVLARLALRLDQTQLDLRELKVQNDDNKKDFEMRLNQAAEANQQLIRQGN